MPGELAIDDRRRRVAVAGTPVPRTATEYELPPIPSVHAARVVTSESLLRQVPNLTKVATDSHSK